MEGWKAGEFWQEGTNERPLRSIQKAEEFRDTEEGGYRKLGKQFTVGDNEDDKEKTLKMTDILVHDNSKYIL